MITHNLYDTVLVAPARQGGNKLDIVSGYASGGFAADHLEEMALTNSRPVVRLIVGMFPRIGPLLPNHMAFKQLSETEYPLGFECRYIITPPPVHVKAYTWYVDDAPLCAYVGSANYTRYGFARTGAVTQREAVIQTDPVAVEDYFDTLWDTALDCRAPEADERVAQALLEYRTRVITRDPARDIVNNEPTTLDSVTLSLLDENGEVPRISGLNWGHRLNRNRNEAYITVPAHIGRMGFFPPLKQHFTLLTDDDIVLICVPAQPKAQGGTVPHAIQTPYNNSELGIYFRRRLNLTDGAFVTKQDLLNYGRTDLVIRKIDDETYLMDFSAP